MNSDVVDFFHQGTPRDFWNFQVKLTYVGDQLKSIASVVFTTIFHIMQLDWFLPLQRSDLSYENDKNNMWNFSVTPDEMNDIIGALGNSESVRDAVHGTAPFLSLMIVVKASRLGETGFEIVLEREAAKRAISIIIAGLAEDNGVGRRVMELQRQALFPPGNS